MAWVITLKNLGQKWGLRKDVQKLIAEGELDVLRDMLDFWTHSNCSTHQLDLLTHWTISAAKRGDKDNEASRT